MSSTSWKVGAVKVIVAVSAFVATVALGLGIASSQMLSSAPAPAPTQEAAAAAPASSFNPFGFLAVFGLAPTPAPAAVPATPATTQQARTAPAVLPTAPAPSNHKVLPSLPDLAAIPPAPAPSASTASATPAIPAGPRGPMAFNSAQVDGPYIALTFDDGPNPETTPKLLKMLAERNIKATFFVLGSKAVASPETLKSIVAAGHEVGNHSWNHPQLPKLTVAAVDKQIEDTSAVIESATGTSPKYLRPPYGAMTPSLQHHIEQKYGMSLIYWSVDPLDWKVRDANSIYDQIMKQVRPGAVVLAHDIHATTVAAMPRVLDALIAKGYKFVTISELIAMDKPAAPKVAAVPAAPAPPRKKPRPVQPATTGAPAQMMPMQITPTPTSGKSASAIARPPVVSGPF